VDISHRTLVMLIKKKKLIEKERYEIIFWGHHIQVVISPGRVVSWAHHI
jgi:hypothetical protein